MQSRFQAMSDAVIGRIDEMGARIDDLEKSISQLMEQVRRWGQAGLGGVGGVATPLLLPHCVDLPHHGPHPVPHVSMWTYGRACMCLCDGRVFAKNLLCVLFPQAGVDDADKADTS
jgi:hypothetical protein